MRYRNGEKSSFVIPFGQGEFFISINGSAERIGKPKKQTRILREDGAIVKGYFSNDKAKLYPFKPIRINSFWSDAQTG